ncbi:peroxysomal citrate synthase [Moniliophthora roreri]|uniref:Citrate synthase n=2 Tax=Moniliophthora roreri TaxID=221103 RepID=A0A0W0EXQ7_MONRR|nr:peroxysomal citrate synthase [Moniliophthora roreri]
MGNPLTSKSSNSLTVRDNRTGKTYEIPIEDNTVAATNFKAISAPRSNGEREENETEKGLRVSDKGFLNTAVMRSEITYIDGEAGVLRYRGYPIEQLALHSSHLETAYLLIYGSLPTASQFKVFQDEVMHHSFVHSDAEQFFRSFRYDAHPMSILTSAFAYLGSYYSQTLFTKGTEESLAVMDKQIYRLIGKATTLAAMAYRVRQGRDFVTPPHGLSYTGSFLYQMDHLGQADYKPNPVLEKALDVLFLIHADHELNASATTVLQTGSSLVDPYSAIAAGCASLYGPLHGGANEAVIRMLISIGRPENVPEFLEAVKRREKVLSGFGHRVYKTSDPRSFIVRKTADEVFKVTGKDELLETAMALHEAAMKDEYFIKRKLAPNVDFWSVSSFIGANTCAHMVCGLIYRAMGFPLDFFPVLFAVPRVVGWLAHWRQMMLQPGGVKIWRPRQVYVGASKRDYVPVEDRVPVEGLKKTPSPVVHSGPTAETNMFATFITVVLFVAASIRNVAAFTIYTPQMTQCQDVQISWEATKGPYNILVVPANDPCEGEVLADLGDNNGTSITWKPDLPAGWQVVLSALDGNDEEAWSGTITIGGGDSSCVRAEFASPSSPAAPPSSAPASAAPASLAPASVNNSSSPPLYKPSQPTANGPLGGVASDPLTGGALRQTTTPMLILGTVSAVLAFAL